MSRRPNPGETSMFRHGLQEETQNHNRIVLGQIISVNEENGIVTVAVLGAPQVHYAIIPLQGLSVNQFGSSWMRYMPQQYDFVKLGFDHNNRPQLLGAAAWGDQFSLSDTGKQAPAWAHNIGGYAQIKNLAKDVKSGLSAFVPLKQGEWDMRSSGDAYIHGSNRGRLLLAGGTVRVELRKQSHEIDTRAGLIITGDGEGSAFRLGDIKRKLLPTDATETAIVGASKEYDLTVKTGGAVSLSMYQTRVGDVRDALGLPELAGGIPLRARTTYYDATGLANALEATVDVNGNVSFTHGAFATTGLSLTGATGTLNTSYLNTTIQSTVDTTIKAMGTATVSGDAVAKLVSTVLAQVDARSVQLGGPDALVNAAVHSVPLLVILNAINAGLLQLAATMTGLEGGPITPKGAAWAGLTTALAIVTTTLAIPPGTPASVASAKVFVG